MKKPVCTICGKRSEPGACGCWIQLVCPACGRTELTRRTDADPSHAAMLETPCPEHDVGEGRSERYLDSRGREVEL